QTFDRLRRDGFVRDLEMRVRAMSGELRDVIVSIERVDLDGVSRFITTFVDITERRAAESAIKDSLREKEVLLQEVHHRVKNNLQVIASLINMQLRKIDNDVARRALEECQTRILAIAMIHEKLYQSKDYGRVPFHDYIRGIAGNVFDATGVSSGHVALELA